MCFTPSLPSFASFASTPPQDYSLEEIRKRALAIDEKSPDSLGQYFRAFGIAKKAESRNAHECAELSVVPA